MKKDLLLKRFIMLFVLATIMVLVPVVTNNYHAAGPGGANHFADNGNGGGGGGTPTYEPVINDAEENYAYKSNNYYYAKYSGNGNGRPLNEEKYKVVLHDMEGGSVKLNPVTSLNVAPSVVVGNNVGYNYCQVSFEYKTGIDFGNNIWRCSDTRQYKDLHSDFAKAGDQTTIGLGKIFYRSQVNPFPMTAEWQNTDFDTYLNSNGYLPFDLGYFVQIVILYEIYEGNQGLFNPAQVYHVRAIYTFQAQA